MKSKHYSSKKDLGIFKIKHFKIVLLFFLILFTTLVSGQDRMIAYYPFDGNLNDESGSNNHFILSGNISYANNRFNAEDKALRFNGDGSYIKSNFKMEGYWSISFWHNPLYISDNDQFLLLGDYSLYNDLHMKYTEGELLVNFVNTSTNKVSQITTEKWYHVVVTFDGNNVKVYQDKDLVATINQKPNFNFTGSLLRIGSRYGQQAAQLLIDDIRVYNYALSASEIEQLNNGNHQESKLIAYYPFNGNTNDESGSGNEIIRESNIRYGENRFNSVNQSLYCNNLELITENRFDLESRTVSAWVKVNRFPDNDYQVVFSNDGNRSGKKYGSFGINTRSDHSIGLMAGGSNTYILENSVQDRWYHFVLMQDKNIICYYVNGEKVATKEANKVCSDSSDGRFRIGAHRDGLLRHSFQSGFIDDLRIYNYALSESEILTLYNENGWTGDSESTEPLINILPPYTFVSYQQNELDLNKFYINVQLSLEDSVEQLNNIKMEVYLNGDKMHLHINNSDSLIDNIPTGSFKFILASTETPIDNFEDYEVVVKISSIDGVQTSFVKKDTLSYYKVKGFEMSNDSYNFPNPSNMSFSEFKSYIDLVSPGEDCLVASFKSFMSYGGRCFGMATSSGAYFLNENLKPISGVVHGWESTNLSVMENITNYQLKQYKYIFKKYDNAASYENLLKDIKSSNPVVISLSKENGNGRHAVLCYSVTEFTTENISSIQIYDNNTPDLGRLAVYDRDNKTFSYSPYNEFYAYEQDIFNSSDIKTLINSFNDNLIASLNNKFKIFATACPVNLCVTNNDGDMCGFLEDGTRVNTMSGTEIYRIPTEDFEGDSITLIYVPVDSDYSCEINSYQEGNLRFEYYNPLDAETLYTAFADSIEISNFSRLTFNDTIPAIINIDEDGDGEFESNVATIQNPILFTYSEQIKDGQVKIYPNPAKEYVYIKFEKDVTKKVQINIYNIFGQSIFTSSEVNGNVYEWKRTNNYGNKLNNGIYFIELIINDKKFVEKILLE